MTSKPPFDEDVSSDVPAAPDPQEVARPASFVRPLPAPGQTPKLFKSSLLGEGHETRPSAELDVPERSSLNDESSPHMTEEDAESDESCSDAGVDETDGNDCLHSPQGPRSAFVLLARMRNGWRFPPPAPGAPEISDGAKTLVFALLTENPSLRLSAERALKDEWLSLSSSARIMAQPPRFGRIRAYSSPTFSAAACAGSADLEALRSARMVRRNTETTEHFSAAGFGELRAAHEPVARTGDRNIARGGAYARSWPVMITTRSSESYRDTTEEDDEDDDPPFRSTGPSAHTAPLPMIHRARSLLPLSDADDSEPESSPEGRDDIPLSTARPTRPLPTTRESGVQRPPAIQRRRPP